MSSTISGPCARAAPMGEGCGCVCRQAHGHCRWLAAAAVTEPMRVTAAQAHRLSINALPLLCATSSAPMSCAAARNQTGGYVVSCCPCGLRLGWVRAIFPGWSFRCDCQVVWVCVQSCCRWGLAPTSCLVGLWFMRYLAVRPDESFAAGVSLLHGWCSCFCTLAWLEMPS
jgi:hypothetical protein